MTHIKVMLQSSTCFEQYYAHPQEVKLYVYSVWYRLTIPYAVYIQFDLLRMSIILLETCRGL